MTNFITSGAAVFKAGLNVSTAIPGAAWVDWISGAQAMICAVSRYNWVDNYATLDTDTKHILSNAGAQLVAIDAINYDMSGYTSRGEAESMLMVLRDGYLRAMTILKEQKAKDFINT